MEGFEIPGMQANFSVFFSLIEIKYWKCDYYSDKSWGKFWLMSEISVMCWITRWLGQGDQEMRRWIIIWCFSFRWCSNQWFLEQITCHSLFLVLLLLIYCDRSTQTLRVWSEGSLSLLPLSANLLPNFSQGHLSRFYQGWMRRSSEQLIFCWGLKLMEDSVLY